ncbi:hypothetical protein NQ317_010925 [Molorchus minor]|uniref:Uncharacterized protein n=1 Tax=Molorchus minor TaxID=1323400 RepID=A0ABQ9J2R3_9CUCU|nr:hypothetical protein NQ317_010925 [Molorchus minor]
MATPGLHGKKQITDRPIPTHFPTISVGSVFIGGRGVGGYWAFQITATTNVKFSVYPYVLYEEFSTSTVPAKVDFSLSIINPLDRNQFLDENSNCRQVCLYCKEPQHP